MCIRERVRATAICLSRRSYSRLCASIGGGVRISLVRICSRAAWNRFSPSVPSPIKSCGTPATKQRYEQGRLGGVHFYAFLCERLFGRRPDRIQLLYLQEPVAIIAEPSEQSIKGLEQRATAIWHAVERACETENFKPRPSGLCEWCSFRQYCPAWGGDPAQAKELLPLVPA